MRRLTSLLLCAGICMASVGCSSSTPSNTLSAGDMAGVPHHRPYQDSGNNHGGDSTAGSVSVSAAGSTNYVGESGVAVSTSVFGPSYGNKPSAGSSADGGPVTVDTIKNMYAPKFSSLQSSCEGQLSSLFESAKAEYDNRKSSGESASDIRNQYNNAVDDLQGQCNEEFSNILDAMRADLQKHYLPTDACDAEQSRYDQRVQALKSEYIERARQEFK